MNEAYAERLKEILKRTRPRLAYKYDLEFKNVFGAVGGYANGVIFISCGKFGVALRLRPETLEKVFKEKGVEHLKYFSKGHIKQEYAVIPKRILDDKKEFGMLLDDSLKYARAID
jgi:TfoX/Sxy family transcriptional regulator of competence genes